MNILFTIILVISCAVAINGLRRVPARGKHAPKREGKHNELSNDEQLGLESQGINCKEVERNLTKAERDFLRQRCNHNKLFNGNLLESGRCTVKNLKGCYKDIFKHFNITNINEALVYMKLDPFEQDFNIENKCKEVSTLNSDNAEICIMNAKEDCPKTSSILNLIKRADVNKLTTYYNDYCYGCENVTENISTIKKLIKENTDSIPIIYEKNFLDKSYDSALGCKQLQDNLNKMLDLSMGCDGLIKKVNETADTMKNSILKGICIFTIDLPIRTTTSPDEKSEHSESSDDISEENSSQEYSSQNSSKGLSESSDSLTVTSSNEQSSSSEHKSTTNTGQTGSELPRKKPSGRKKPKSKSSKKKVNGERNVLNTISSGTVVFPRILLAFGTVMMAVTCGWQL